MSYDPLAQLVSQTRAYAEWLQRQGLVWVPAPRAPVLPVSSRPVSLQAAPQAQAAAALTAVSTGALTLEQVRAELGDCTRCKLHGGRKHIVFGVGNPSADLVFVGEGPGFEEDRRGEPFVGPAGQLLDKMIAAMGLVRQQIYIANVIKCRPPGNRNPEPDEVAACEPFLRQQIDAIRPRLIVALGKFAAQTLLRSSAPISALRGRWHTYQGIQLMPTYHPAFLLRSPERKRDAWLDLQAVMAERKRLGL